MNDHKGQQNIAHTRTPNDNEMSFGFFLRKTEKLTTAMYMITDIISDKEPMRWKIREEAMSLLSLMGNMGISDIASRWNVFYQILQSIERIENLIEMSKTAKLISEMNASVVFNEYTELKNRLRASWSTLRDKSQVKLTEGFFVVEKESVDEIIAPVRAPAIPKPIASPRTAMSDKISIGQSNERKTAPAISRPDVPYTPVKDNHSGRRKIILDMLKSKPEVSVSDIKASVPGVSDKTIQRELIGMVEDGVLMRKGDRRWSTYSLPASVSHHQEEQKEMSKGGNDKPTQV